jgi:lysyl-tRNA synthetase class I
MDGLIRRRYIVFMPICEEAGNIKEETVNDQRPKTLFLTEYCLW